MKRTKTIIAVILTVVLCLGLLGSMAGCQKTKDPSNEPSTPPTSNGGSNDGTTPAPDAYVYTSKYVPVAGSQSGFEPLACINDRILASSWEKIGENIPEGAVPEYEGQYDVYGMKLYMIGTDGSYEELKGFQPIQASGENGSSYVQKALSGPNGKILVLESVYNSWYDGPETDLEMYSDEWYEKGYSQYMQFEQKHYLRTLGSDGSEENRIDMMAAVTEALGEMDYFYPNGVAVDGTGNIYIVADSSIVIIGDDGSLKKTLTASNWIENICCFEDGRIGVICYPDMGGEQLCFINAETLELNEEQTYPVTNVWNFSIGGGDYDFYYTNGSNFMGFDLETGKVEKVFNWINADVDNSSINQAYVLSDGRVVSLSNEWDENTGESSTNLVIVSKVPASTVEQKTKIKMAVMYLDGNLQRMVVKFNRNSPHTRIEILDYSEYNTQDDYEAGITKLNTEIMAGNVPDILSLTGLSTGKLANKGILEDLMPYLNEDPDLKDQLFDSVLDALMTNGKLYRTASSFNISTVMGAASVVGTEPGWTLEEYSAALKSMPAGCEPFSQGTTRDTVFQWGLAMEMNNLVDWSTGKCSFDTPVFTGLLEFARQFPRSEDIDWENIEWEDENERIASGKQMLMITSLNDFDSIQMYEAMFGGEASFIGFPTNVGTGNRFSFDDEGYAICSKSQYKDAAWEFLRTLMTAEYQQEYTWSFPTNRVAFDKKLADAMTPIYRKDENGNFVLDENGEKIEESRGSWGWGSLIVDMKALTQEEADKIMQLVETTDKVDNYDEELMNMITSESEAFFAGQKSAEEIGRLLQSKMSIYINEQR